jgi:hypothetical protein
VSDPTLVSLFIPPLNRLGIPYMVTGAVATAVYGEPRLTRDIDLVIALRSADARRFAAAWPEAGFDVAPAEAIEEEARRPSGGHFTVSHHDTGLRADVYLAGDEDFQHWALERAAAYDVDGDPVCFAPAEYVIVNKLRYYRMGGSERHLRDIAGILDVRAGRVDLAEVDRWARELGVLREWRKARVARP